MKEDIIEPVTFSEWTAPIVPIVKDDGGAVITKLLQIIYLSLSHTLFSKCKICLQRCLVRKPSVNLNLVMRINSLSWTKNQENFLP